MMQRPDEMTAAVSTGRIATAAVLDNKTSLIHYVESGYIGCNTGYVKKLSSIQAQLGQATCLADA